MFRRITCAGLPLTSLCFALIASATQAVAQQAPAIHIGSDTRAKSAGQCMTDAKFAITETGLQVVRASGPAGRNPCPGTTTSTYARPLVRRRTAAPSSASNHAQ